MQQYMNLDLQENIYFINYVKVYTKFNTYRHISEIRVSAEHSLTKYTTASANIAGKCSKSCTNWMILTLYTENKC